MNPWHIQGSTRKSCPPQVLAGLRPHVSADWPDDMNLIGQPLDGLGVNDYTRHTVADDPVAPWPSLKNIPGTLPETRIGWQIFPGNPRNVFSLMSRDPVVSLPLHDTGMAHANILQDHAASVGIHTDYLFAHPASTRPAIAEAAIVTGFCYRCRLDNYNWAGGHETRFVHVNFETLERPHKSAYHAVARATARNDKVPA